MQKDFFTTKMLFLGITFLTSGVLWANDPYDGGDCPLVIPEFDNTVLLTREERIQRMDQALKDALGQVQNCRQALSDMGEGDSNTTGSAALDVVGSDAGSDTTGYEDNARPDQAAIDDTEIEANNAEKAQPARPDSELSGTEVSAQRTGSMPDGKLPEDIPSADNDNIIARQIREAASSEPDPEKQAKLWNEYRRYKGLPEK